MRYIFFLVRYQDYSWFFWLVWTTDSQRLAVLIQHCISRPNLRINYLDYFSLKIKIIFFDQKHVQVFKREFEHRLSGSSFCGQSILFSTLSVYEFKKRIPLYYTSDNHRIIIINYVNNIRKGTSLFIWPSMTPIPFLYYPNMNPAFMCRLRRSAVYS